MSASRAYQGMLRSAGVGTEDVISYVNQSRREAAAEIRDLLRQTSEDHTRYGVVIGDSHPARAIRRAVEMYQPDLLVMGTSGGRVRRALIGSVASQVMDAAGCDVLVVPRGSVPPRNVQSALSRIPSTLLTPSACDDMCGVVVCRGTLV